MHYFLVYNDNTHWDSLNLLLQSVEKYGPQFQIILFHKEDIDDEFYQKNQAILNSKRGGGYWLWKPYIINQVLDELQEKDVLFYLDSRYCFTEPFEDLYREPLERGDLLVFKNKPNESPNAMKHLCKMDVILKYDMYNRIMNQNVEEFWAGCIILKKTEKTTRIIREWLAMCCQEEDITDKPSQAPNPPCFWDHKHDQALLSILLHKQNIPSVYFERKYLQNMRIPYG